MADSVTIVATPDPSGQAAHDAAMIAVAEGQAPAVPSTPAAPDAATPAERPAWLPEEYATAEDMAKAFQEMKAKQATPDSPAAPENAPADAPADDAAAALEVKGLNLQDFSQEFSTSGELSAESYTKLEEAGFPKAIVDQYIEGQRALADRYHTDVVTVAGGEEKFGEVASWAAENLTDAEKVAYNKAIDSGDINQAKLAVQGLTAKYDAAHPTEGNLLGGRFSSATADRYESTAQVTADMRDPRYAKDPAFRRMVEQKIARSEVI